MSGAPARQLTVDGFRHLGGLHCETTALRKVLAHGGVELSEETLLGLGGGIGFIYWWRKGMPIPFVGGRNGGCPHFLEALVGRLGHPGRLRTTRSASSGYRHLLANLEAGRPTLCYGDVFHLPHMGAQGHFGGHTFVIYGIDEASGMAELSDRGSQPVRIALDDLARARGSASQPFPPKHRWLEIEVDPGRRPTREDHLLAIADCVEAMVRPPIRNIGLKGMAKLAGVMGDWLESFPDDELVDLLVGLYMNLELAGTGGCAFRTMYRVFLDETRAQVEHPDLDLAIARLDEAIVAWRGLIDGLLPIEVPSLAAIRDHLHGRQRAFEDAAGSAAADQGFDALRRRAISQLATDRRSLGGLVDRILDIRQREERCFEALGRVALLAPDREPT